MSELGQMIHADEKGKDLRVIYLIAGFDAVADLGGVSDWVLKIPPIEFETQPVEIGHRIYIEGTEWGGIVNRIKTSAEEVEIGGASWRGLLRKNLIVPPPGAAYKIVKAPAAQALRELTGSHFGDLFEVAEGDAVTLTEQFRYQSIGEGAEAALAKAGARLEITAESGRIKLRARRVTDWSAQYELNADYGAVLTIERDESEMANHIIALGRGELAARMVLEAWLLPDGSITYDRKAAGVPQGLAEITYKLDYPNVESEGELREKIAESFKERSRIHKAEIDLNDVRLINLELGDVIATRDRLTRTYAKTSIAKKIYKIEANGKQTLRYEVAGDGKDGK